MHEHQPPLLFTATAKSAVAPIPSNSPFISCNNKHNLHPAPISRYPLSNDACIGVHNMSPIGESKVSSLLSSPMSNLVTGSTNYPTTPPILPDLSRPRLRQIAQWIRDELDLRVAREGPDILRPDDVLTLHETFITLRHAQNIKYSDLRATGIHKAIQDISGVATRWPGRLCDDCDKIIDIWTAKFGPFSDIRPFLFGRGGRLEGIASINEYSREVGSSAYSHSLSN
jgi:hypothetical protein